jgi:hypothetical protein
LVRDPRVTLAALARPGLQYAAPTALVEYLIALLVTNSINE